MPASRTITLIMLFLLVQPVQAGLVKIGVFSPEGFETGMHRWQPTADYLETRLPAHRFQVLPYQDLTELEQDARRGKFDFVLTQPASFVRLEQQAGLIRLLTRAHQDQSRRHMHAATVVFTRADNLRLHHLTDLDRTPFISTAEQDYSGWQLVRLELQRRQRDTADAFSRIGFAGNAEGVLHGVMSGDYPAGAMAAREFDRLLRQERITPQAVRILDAQSVADYPFRFSGKLYPQWPLGTLPDTPAPLRSAVMQALLNIPDGHAALRAGNYAGWQSPSNYRAVRPLLEKSLTRHVVERQLNLTSVWLAQYQPGLFVALVLTLMIWLFMRLLGQTRRQGQN